MNMTCQENQWEGNRAWKSDSHYRAEPESLQLSRPGETYYIITTKWNPFYYLFIYFLVFEKICDLPSFNKEGQ